MKQIACLISFLSFYFVSSQTEVFHDFSYEFNVNKSDEWDLNSEFEWKHLYGEEGWSRMSFDLKTRKELGVLELIGGLKNNYTFDDNIVNFWEIRPWIGVELENKLSSKLILKQELKGEFRNFFFNDSQYDFNFRTKFKIGLEYPLKSVEEEEGDDWIIATEVEWFFLRNVEINERYINSREYSILVSKKVLEGRLLAFGVRFEEYSNNLENESDKAITVVLRLGL
ncbi:MAG: hypothetical protein HRU26_14845 [Psychroserpens sp.]|nr:hypothetical protein [Psychroserpens sp.]